MRKILIVHRDRRDQINTWLDHHPILDVRGGGGDTFKKQMHVIGGGVNAVHYIASWKMPDAWFAILLDWLVQRNWNVNVSDVSWDFSWYDGETTLRREAHADLVRKPYALEYVEEDI